MVPTESRVMCAYVHVRRRVHVASCGHAAEEQRAREEAPGWMARRSSMARCPAASVNKQVSSARRRSNDAYGMHTIPHLVYALSPSQSGWIFTITPEGPRYVARRVKVMKTSDGRFEELSCDSGVAQPRRQSSGALGQLLPMPMHDE
jgi:hypothetical protein